MSSKLIPAAQAEVEQTLTLPAAPEPVWSVPIDIMKAIEREAEADPSDPFIARRLAAHYRQGIWSPADAKAKK